MLEHISRDWMKELVNCFLIRQPDEVLASYLRSREEATDDLGFARQAELVETAKNLQGEVIILESSDLLKDPVARLVLCASIFVSIYRRNAVLAIR